MTIDKVLSKPIEAGLIPGVVARAADNRGIIYQGAFGRRAADKPEPMTLDSVFRIASMTKAVTGTAAMQLVENGQISLEQPMGDFRRHILDPLGMHDTSFLLRNDMASRDERKKPAKPLAPRGIRFPRRQEMPATR